MVTDTIDRPPVESDGSAAVTGSDIAIPADVAVTVRQNLAKARIPIPASVDDRLALLTSASEFATAVEWARAALVASLVGPATGPGRKLLDSQQFLSVSDLASHKIIGLRDRNTIAAYRDAWFAVRDEVPGGTVDLSELPPWDERPTKPKPTVVDQPEITGVGMPRAETGAEVIPFHEVIPFRGVSGHEPPLRDELPRVDRSEPQASRQLARSKPEEVPVKDRIRRMITDDPAQSSAEIARWLGCSSDVVRSVRKGMRDDGSLAEAVAEEDRRRIEKLQGLAQELEWAAGSITDIAAKIPDLTPVADHLVDNNAIRHWSGRLRAARQSRNGTSIARATAALDKALDLLDTKINERLD